MNRESDNNRRRVTQQQIITERFYPMQLKKIGNFSLVIVEIKLL